RVERRVVVRDRLRRLQQHEVHAVARRWNRSVPRRPRRNRFDPGGERVAEVRPQARMTRIGVAALLGFAVLGAAASARAGSPQQVPTLYAVASKVQFIDHADDRQRGLEKNPFNADVKKLDPKAEAQEKGKGPFPGDDALFTFKLYTDASLKKSAGTAVYECVYNFHKHAMCKAVFDLKAGSLFASGPVDFNSAHI